MQAIDLQGYKMPVLGLGTWMLQGSACVGSVQIALDAGYRHIDTAQFYKNEADVGQAVKESGIDREDIFFTTKIMPDNFLDMMALKSVEDSLKKLKTEYIDLLLIHWPVSDISVEKIITIMQEIRQTGKAKRIGVSNFNVAQMKEAVKTAGNDIVCNQVEYHPYLSQKSVLEYARTHDIAVTAYCPVARKQLLDETVLKEIGLKYAKSTAQISLRWLIQQERVAAIPKSGTEKHIRENFDIFDFNLSEDEMAAIHVLARPNSRIVDFGREDWDQAC